MGSMIDRESERALFEAWCAVSDGLDTEKLTAWYFDSVVNGDGEHEYTRYSVNRAWMGWLAKADSAVVTEEMVPEPYRILETTEGFEPAMRYTAGAVDGEFWYPLNSQGSWLEPEAFSLGNPELRHFMSTREEALRVIERAKIINADGQIIHTATLEGGR